MTGGSPGAANLPGPRTQDGHLAGQGKAGVITRPLDSARLSFRGALAGGGDSVRQTTVSVTLTLRGRRNTHQEQTWNPRPHCQAQQTQIPPRCFPRLVDSLGDGTVGIASHVPLQWTPVCRCLHILWYQLLHPGHRCMPCRQKQLRTLTAQSFGLGGRQGDICRLKHGPLKSSDGPARFPIHPSALATFCRRAICALGEPDAGCHPTARSDIARCSDGRPDADSTMRRCKMHHNQGGKGSWAVGQEYRIPPVYLYICLGTLGEETMLRAQLQSGRADRLVVLYKVLPRMTTEGFRRPTPTPRPPPGLLEP